MEYILHQATPNSCGSASLKMLLANLFKKEKYLYINYRANNASLEDLIREAKKYEVEMSAYDTSEDKEKIKEIKTPIIAVINTGNTNHYVYIKKPNRAILTIYDPVHGKYYVRRSVFLKYFTGYFIKVESYNIDADFEIAKIKRPVKSIIFNIILQLFTVVAFLGAFYTMDENYTIGTSLSFLGISALLLYIERLQLNYAMKRYDYDVIMINLGSNTTITPQILKTSMEYKKIMFGNPLLFINNILMLAVIATFIAINEWIHLLALAIAVSIILILKEVSIFYKGKATLKLTENEQALYKHAYLEDEGLDYAQAVAETSYRYGNFVISLNVIKEVVTIGLVMLVMGVSEIAAANYFIFYYFTYHLCLDKIGEILSSTTKAKTVYDYKEKFYNIMYETSN